MILIRTRGLYRSFVIAYNLLSGDLLFVIGSRLDLPTVCSDTVSSVKGQKSGIPA